MKIDDLNNSQLILMVLLITLVVSAAVSVATLSVVYERVVVAESDGSTGPTIIQRTINRIIEREKTSSTLGSGSKINSSVNVSQGQITLEKIQGAFARVFFGSIPTTAGIFISPEGNLLTADRLKKQRQYHVKNGRERIFFEVLRSDDNYSVLAPTEGPYTPTEYLALNRPVAPEEVTIGQSTLLFGGFGDEVGLHSEIVSRKKTEQNGTATIRTSVDPSEVTLPSVVLVNDEIVGFASNYSGWIPLLTESLFEKKTEENDKKESEDVTVIEGIPNL